MSIIVTLSILIVAIVVAYRKHSVFTLITLLVSVVRVFVLALINTITLRLLIGAIVLIVYLGAIIIIISYICAVTPGVVRKAQNILKRSVWATGLAVLLDIRRRDRVSVSVANKTGVNFLFRTWGFSLRLLLLFIMLLLIVIITTLRKRQRVSLRRMS
jgi:energy-coupling factor transporter transmembrane protein EcfT